MLIGIDETLELKKLDLYIAKPDKTVIGHLNESYNESLNPKMGNLSELSFTIPYLIDKNNELIDNPNIDKIKDRYLIKVIYDNKIEWFRINDINENSDDSGDTVNFHAFSLGIELGDKLIRNVKETSKNINYILNLALSETTWTVGSIDMNLRDLPFI